MNPITKKLIDFVSDVKEDFKGSYHIRENGKNIECHSSDNITITDKENHPGLNVVVQEGTVHETVCVPATVTVGGLDDIVRNDFTIGDNCDITIVSGCGVHTEDEGRARHDGVHHFVIGKNSKVKYVEKHIGTGSGNGEKTINPQSFIHMMEGSFLEMDVVQISGVDVAKRSTKVTLEAGAKLIVHERLFTQGNEKVDTDFVVELNGENSSADVVSRTVARDESYQNFTSTLIGNAACSGHSECDSIIDENAIVDSTPRLVAKCKEASLIHEAAIGKIAGEQIVKLQTFGLSQEEAENQIIDGFLA